VANVKREIKSCLLESLVSFEGCQVFVERIKPKLFSPIIHKTAEKYPTCTKGGHAKVLRSCDVR